MGTVQIDGSTPKLTIGNATAEDASIVYDGNAKDFYIALDDSADKLVIGEGSTVGTNSILTITDDSVTIGDASAVDTKIVFDGNAQDFYIALDDSADDLLIGKGSTVGTTPAIAIDENLKVNIPVTTASTSASTGSLTTGGGAGIGADLYVGDDAYLITDSAVLGFGADKDTLLTHTDGTGLTLNSTNKLCFNDVSQFVQGISGTVLGLGATDEIDLTATAVDLNGTLDVSGTTTLGGTLTVNAGAVFNEGSGDNDFRIESTDAAKAFTIDGTKAHMHMTGTSAGTATKISSHSGGTGSIQLGIGCNIHSYDYSVLDGPYIMQNAWLSAGTAKYVGTGAAGKTGYYGGIWRFWNAASGSEDDDITFDERFRIALDGTLTATDTSIGSNSDSRIKENISDFTYDLSKFKQLQPRTFDWKNPSQHNGASGNRGFVAQEVQAIDDYWIGEIELDEGTLDYDLIPEDESGEHKSLTSKLGKKDAMYISVINQLIARIEALEA